MGRCRNFEEVPAWRERVSKLRSDTLKEWGDEGDYEGYSSMCRMQVIHFVSTSVKCSYHERVASFPVSPLKYERAICI